MRFVNGDCLMKRSSILRGSRGSVKEKLRQETMRVRYDHQLVEMTVFSESARSYQCESSPNSQSCCTRPWNKSRVRAPYPNKRLGDVKTLCKLWQEFES